MKRAAAYTGNAEGSTLRKTPGRLLASKLGIELRRVGSGERMKFVTSKLVRDKLLAVLPRVLA